MEQRQGSVEDMGVTADQYWLGRRVLVTGATGLVGGWLVEKLVRDGAEPVALVRDWVPGSRLLAEGMANRVTVVRGDVRDQACLERVLGEYEITAVIHLAAQTIVPIANRNPVFTFESNIQGTWALLEACRRSPLVASIVVASSDKAYGTADRLPYDETMPLRGLFPYDASKACADIIAQSYAASFGLPVAITRCGNFYGGGDLNWNRLIPGTIRSLYKGESPVIRSDGRMKRDYIYVEDAVDAYMLLTQELARRPELKGEAFNFSIETPLSVLEVVDAIAQTMDTACQPVVLNQASNEIPDQFLDAGKARRILGWQPVHGLDTGLRRTIAWYRSHLESLV